MNLIDSAKLTREEAEQFAQTYAGMVLDSRGHAPATYAVAKLGDIVRDELAEMNRPIAVGDRVRLFGRDSYPVVAVWEDWLIIIDRGQPLPVRTTTVERVA